MKIKNIFLLASTAVMLSACDDLWEPAEENNSSLSEMYTQPTFARGILDNAWVVLPYNDGPDKVNSDMATDDAVSNSTGNDNYKMATGQWSSQFNPVSRWDAGYHAIQYINIFLENCDQVTWVIGNELRTQMYNDNYKGNAYALRAIHHFAILRAHAGMVDGQLLGIPMHLRSEDGGSNFNNTRLPFEECIKLIMADLDEALKYVPETYGEGSIPAKYQGANSTDWDRAFGEHHRGRVDAKIIAAIKAQVANFAASPAYASANAMSWKEAAEYAVKSLEYAGGLKGMSATGWRWFAEKTSINAMKATDLPPAEIVWRGNLEESTSWEERFYPPSQYGNGLLNPSQNLVDAFPMANGYPITDPASGYDPANPYAGRDPRLAAYIVYNGQTIGAKDEVINTAADNAALDGLNYENEKSTRSGYYLRKHLRDDVSLDPSSTKKQFHCIARIRYTEIFLDYAEAANEAQDPTAKVGDASFSAYDVIKALRERAGVGGTDDPYLESCKNDQAKMRELIRNERRLELCFEGLRFWDLRRWQAPLSGDVKGVKITNGSTYDYFTVESHQYQDYMNYGPIPYSEIQKWSDLKQNAGW